MKVLHLLVSGGTGGIETLCKDYATYSRQENYFLFIWGAGCVADEMSNIGARVIVLNSQKQNFIVTVKWVLDICKKESIDAIVTHHASPFVHIIMLMVKVRYPHIITIAYAHGHAKSMYRADEKKGSKFRRMVLAASLKMSNRVVAISQSVKDSLIECFHTKSEKITVIYNGVDLNRFAPLVHTDIENLKCIYVGRLVEDKGVQVILKGLAGISNDLKLKLLIVGDGPYRSQLEKLSHEYKLDDKVKFLGNRRDIPQLLKDSNVFIHLPLCEEGFGITIVEAMATGLLCVCARSGAIPEIISDGNNGYLIDKNNSAQLAEVIKHIADYGIDVRMMTAATETAKRFGVRAFVKQLDSLITKQ